MLTFETGCILIISILNSFIVFIFAVYCSFYTARNRKQLPLISWSFIAIALIYGIGSSVIFSAVADNVYFMRSDVIYNARYYWPFYGPMVLILTLSILLGWSLPLITRKYINKISYFTFDTNNKENLIIAFVLLLISFILRFIYVSAFGGFEAYIEYSRAVRSGVSSINNPFSFLQPFSGLAILSSFYFWSLVIKKYRFFLSFTGLILSVAFSIYILLTNAGRVGFLLYFATFFIACIYTKKIKPFNIILIALFGFPLAILLLYYGSLYFNIKASNSISYYFIKEISFVFVSFFIQLLEGDPYRIFIDFFMAPTHLLPSSLTLGWYETIEQTNTILVSGAKNGEDGVIGGIPVDLLTLGFMQLNAFGIFPVGILFGFLVKNLDYFLNKIKSSTLKAILVTYLSLRIGFIGVLYSQPTHLINGLFSTICLILILLLFKIPNKIKVK